MALVSIVQLKTGDSHMLQMDHLRKDFSSTLLEPMDANPVDDLIIYLDLFLKRNKMQFHDAAGDTRNGDVIQVGSSGKTSFTFLVLRLLVLHPVLVLLLVIVLLLLVLLQLVLLIFFVHNRIYNSVTEYKSSRVGVVCPLFFFFFTMG